MQIYFDNAATSSPKPAAVQQEVLRSLRDFNANPGRSGHEAALEAARCVFRTREALSDFLGAPEGSCVAF